MIRIEQKHFDMEKVIKNRGKRILSKFGETSLSDVSNLELKSILKTVTDYWQEFLRPALVSFCCEVVGGEKELADEAGLMFTMISAGLSIHDDIIDKSNEKHYRNTILGEYGLEKALLVGDLLILKAWTKLANIIRTVTQPKKIENIMKTYIVEVCEAQLMELSFRQELNINLETYKIFFSKINADLKACAKVGAILGGGSNDEVQALGNFGEKLGFLIGMRDDLKDVCDKNNLFHRVKYESIPLVLLFAVNSSDEIRLKVEKIIDQSLISSSDFKIIKKYCTKPPVFEEFKKIAEKTAITANNELNKLDPSKAKEVLESMIYLILNKIFIPWP